MASIYEVHFPITSATGGGPPPGSSQDRFAPKYLVGNTANGDSAVAYSTDGFYYIPDPGDGTGIVTALSYANPSDPAFIDLGDVWIRPGTYLVSQTLVVPPTVVVRGSGSPTFILSQDGVIGGPLFSLNNKSALYSMALAHNEPKASGTQYGVVDLRGDAKSALCEDVDVLTLSANPLTSTLYGGFVSWNSNGTAETRLRCVRCSAQYGLNAPVNNFDYTKNLVGYRLKDASLELLDCTAQYSHVGNESGYNVAGENFGLGSLVIRGGTFNGYGGGIFINGLAVTSMLVDGAKISCAYNGASTCVGNYGRTRITLSNCTLNGGGAGQAIYLDPNGAPITDNKGSIVGNTINVGPSTVAWNSIGGVNSGYHVIIGNTYTGTTPVVTGANDEVAHNINI